MICCFSLKNTSHPEFIFSTESGVTCLDFHPHHQSLLAVGCYEGTVMVFDVRNKKNLPIYSSSIRTGKHTDPVWQVHWQVLTHVHILISYDSFFSTYWLLFLFSFLFLFFCDWKLGILCLVDSDACIHTRTYFITHIHLHTIIYTTSFLTSFNTTKKLPLISLFIHFSEFSALFILIFFQSTLKINMLSLDRVVQYFWNLFLLQWCHENYPLNFLHLVNISKTIE